MHLAAPLAAAALVVAIPAIAATAFEYHAFRFDTAAIDGRCQEVALLAGGRRQVDIVEGIGLTPGTMDFLRCRVVHVGEGRGRRFRTRRRHDRPAAALSVTRSGMLPQRDWMIAQLAQAIAAPTL